MNCVKVTKTGQKGIELIKSVEGLYLRPYLCPAGVYTIGYGTTRYPDGRKVAKTDKSITFSQATDYLKYDLKRFELAVDALIRDDINQNQFDALVSFTYNLGEGNLKASTLAKKVNANPQDASIAKEFDKWVMADGKKLAGLVKRRKAEAELYFSK
jgi:lysozyme